MGLFDKVKNIFTEEIEEEPEVKVEQIKKEVTHVPIESPSVRVDEKEDNKEEEKNEEIVSQKNKAVFFSDSDFEDLAKPKHFNVSSQNRSDEFFSKEELAKMYGTSSTKEKKEEPKEKKFKPTPIVSPVYGVLDKNYHKEDIVERKEPVITSKSSITVDTIRNKAYGTLEEQLKDQVLYDKNNKNNDVDLFDEVEKKNDTIIFEDEKKTKKSGTPDELTMDLTKELDNLLMKKQNVINSLETREEKNKDIDKDNLLDLMDEFYDEGSK